MRTYVKNKFIDVGDIKDSIIVVPKFSREIK